MSAGFRESVLRLKDVPKRSAAHTAPEPAARTDVRSKAARVAHVNAPSE